MAKITARGCHEVARAQRDRIEDDGTLFRTVYVLRSDDAVLRTVRVRRIGEFVGTYWQGGAYTKVGTLPAKDGRTPAERFARWAAQRGYEVV